MAVTADLPPVKHYRPAIENVSYVSKHAYTGEIFNHFTQELSSSNYILGLQSIQSIHSVLEMKEYSLEEIENKYKEGYQVIQNIFPEENLGVELTSEEIAYTLMGNGFKISISEYFDSSDFIASLFINNKMKASIAGSKEEVLRSLVRRLY